MAAPAIVGELVERFHAHRETYHGGQYHEAQLREDFLNPFFEALGWDVHNRKGYAEAYREVIHEDAIKIGGRTKAPDYCFRAGGGQRSFFVEAKKPSVDIGEAAGPAFQLRRYAWSAKLPVSILSDFEHLAVYDCRIRPDKTDKAATARIIYRHYTEYLDSWEELFGLFAPENIRRGSLERLVASKKIKKGTAEVDAAFLGEIESWRSELARNLALRNGDLSSRDLNFAVQRTIDRIIFLRICEDRGIEPYGALESLPNGPNIYRRLAERFQRADDRYNSGLFHFTAEKDRAEPPDELTLSLKIDDKPLKEIIQNLYFPESPYEFSVFPAEILGQVYEQFLGKVIRLTKGHQAKVEEKPEVRKAGGVYYTPAYIVDYIVKHTVGKLLEGGGEKAEGGKGKAEGGGADERSAAAGTAATPTQAARLRILDPACGSGSFLIGAYQYLLNWHRDWYVSDGAEKHARGRNPKLYRGPADDWRLTTAEKKRILLNNIYGVDIDSQAVEVTKLSLLLKVLEGESKETVNNQLRLLHERALPDLGANIKCGNSLIGPDFYQGWQLSLLDDEQRYRINAFEWKAEFPQVFKAGGFDAVIGNPPWVIAGYYAGSELDYLRRRYTSAEGKFDLYYLFLEFGTRLLKEAGCCGMIVPNKFFHTRAARKLRGYLAAERMIHTVIDFGYEKVFAGPTNYPCIILLQRTPSRKFRFARALGDLSIVESNEFAWKLYDDRPWHFADPRTKSMFTKMEDVGTPLETIVERFGTGVQTGADRILVIGRETPADHGLEKGILRPILRGRDVRRYHLSKRPKNVIFPYSTEGDEFAIFDEEKLRTRFKRAYQYLEDNKASLSKRVWFGKSATKLSGRWYGMMYLDSAWTFAKPHLLTPSLSNVSNFALGNGSLFATGTAGVTSIIPRRSDQSILYLLGLLNSSLMSFYATRHSPVFQGGYHKFSAPYLKNLPIRMIDFSNRADKSRHDRMVELVEAMLALHKKLSAARTEHDKTVLERQIAATDRQIDQLVYELYGLSDEEIAIVEQSALGRDLKL
jgi:type I restriction-modification system DNA methylase subunit/predicted type IV restriction endonuclease